MGLIVHKSEAGVGRKDTVEKLLIKECKTQKNVQKQLTFLFFSNNI